ncbi:MAG: FKBP-type peptidyl-prolyl cis-trans isomerase [Bacteroidota bacterium]
MRKTNTLLAVLSVFLLSIHLQAQDVALADWLAEKGIMAESTADGLYYAMDQAGNGAIPKTGDYVMLRYSGRLLDSTLFDQSPADDPFVFQLGYRQVILGWELGIPLMRVGSKMRLYVPASLAYGNRGAGNSIPPNAHLQYELELLKVMNFEEYDQYMVSLEEKERLAFEQHQKQQFLADKKLINDYALSHKLKTKRTSSGMSYSLTRKGKGAVARPGDILEVQYEGRLIDDTVFDQTVGKQTFRFTLGQGKVIDGWEEGFTHFKKGSEGWLLIPSQMAYGPLAIEEDGISLPANAVLVFKVKVKDIVQQVAKK